jgi:hypothetical protein
MTYTISSKQYTEFDINKRCAELMGVPVSFSRLPNRMYKLSVNSGGFTDEYNSCNNPADTDAIIDKCWDELNRVNVSYDSTGRMITGTKWEAIIFEHNCTKLIAACICYIELNE